MSSTGFATKSTGIDSIHYDVSVLSKTEHLFAVSMKINLLANEEQALNSFIVALPAWIPGSYMIRDFARNLHSLRVVQINDAKQATMQVKTNQVKINQLDKQRWLLDFSGHHDINTIALEYQIYAFDLSVRSAFINDEYAFFNGTSIFLHVQDHENVPHYVTLKRDSDLDNVATAMPLITSDTKNVEPASLITTYKNDDYFELIDHPVIIGKFDDYCFDVMGHRFHLVFTGSHAIDFSQLELDLTDIIEHHIRLFGNFPCKEYWFMTLVCDKGFGGLEHMASTVLQYSRFDLPMMSYKNKSAKSDEHDQREENQPDLSNNANKSASYRTFLSLCSHELFHTWHVKRIKPSVMHQPNLLQEVYTPQLWIYEGFTSFYDDLSLARAGVISPQQYLDVLSEAISRLMRNAGRHKQSVSTSSFEAWSKFYKQDAGSVNHIVSYYNKGAIVALCLDLTLRQQSSNKVSLDDVMRVLWQQYGKTNLGTEDDVIENICKTSFDIDIAGFIHMATQNTMDLPLPSMLECIGVSMKTRSMTSFEDKGGKKAGKLNMDIGAVLSDQSGFIKVNSVYESRAACIAGLQVGDTIVAFQCLQCDLNKLSQLLSQTKLGEKHPLHIIRDGRLLELSFEIFPAIPDTCELGIENSQAFKQWLNLL